MITPLFAWSAIHAIIAAIILFVSIVGGSVFWVLRHIHRRLTDLEEGNEDKQEALFGADRNPLHVGLTREVHDLKEEVEALQNELDEADDERSELKEKLLTIQKKLNRMEQTLEEVEK